MKKAYPVILSKGEKFIVAYVPDFEKMATAIPLALDGGLRQPKVVVCVILTSWEHGNLKTDTNIYYSTT